MSEVDQSASAPTEEVPPVAAVATTRQKRDWWPYLVIIAVILLLYGITVTFDMLSWDDIVLINRNPQVRSVTTANLVKNWTAPYLGIYMPMTYTLWMTEAIPAFFLPHVLGISEDQVAPIVFHAVTVLLFAAIACQLYRLLNQFIPNQWACLLGTLFFIVHPVQAEVVAWVSENKGILSTLFSLLALNSYIDSAKGTNRSRSREDYIWATVYFALALLSKPSSVVLPLVVVLIDWGLLRRPLQKIIPVSLPWFALSIAMVLITRTVQVAAEDVDVAIADRPYIAVDAVAFYLTKVVVPTPLVADYMRTPATVLAEASYTNVIPVVAILATLLVIGVLALRGGSIAAVLILWFLVALLPNLGFIPFAYQLHSTVADRYLSPALIPISFAIAYLAQWLTRPVWRGLILAPLAVLAVMTLLQVQHWRNDDLLYRHHVAHGFPSESMHSNRASYRIRHQDFAGAIEDSKAILAQSPSSHIAYYNLTAAEIRSGKLDDASQTLATALQHYPGDENFLELATAVSQFKRDYPMALKYCEEWMKLNPTDRVRMHYARLLVLSGKGVQGMKLVAEMKKTELSLLEQEQLEAQIFEQDGNTEEAIKRYRAAISRSGNRAQLSQLRLAWILATAEDEKLRDPERASQLIRNLVAARTEESEPYSATFLDIVAAVQASGGAFDEAAITAEKAEEAAIRDKNEALRAKIQGRLKLYREHKAYVSPRPSVIDLSSNGSST